MSRIAQRVADKRLLKLIRAFLNAGMMEMGWSVRAWRALLKEGHFRPCSTTSCSTNSTGNWSTGGIALFDMRTIAILFARCERAGQRVMESVAQFIMQELKLKVNEAKSAVARPQERKCLGFNCKVGSEIKRVIAPKALDRFKQRIREITRRAKGISMEATGLPGLLYQVKS